jgi:hypothetical protein
VRARGDSRRSASQQESLEAICETGRADKHTISPPFLGYFDEHVLWITFQHIAHRPQPSFFQFLHRRFHKLLAPALFLLVK